MRLKVLYDYLKRYSNNIGIELIFIFVLFISLYAWLHNYVVFHAFIELTGIIIAFTIVTIVYSTTHISDNNFIKLLGTGFAIVGFFNILHLLSYKGINIFEGFDANLPTQLWIISKGLQSMSILTAIIFSYREVKFRPILASYFIISILLLLSTFVWRNFPDCYIEGIGLTTFKVISELCIIIVLLLSIGLLIERKKVFDKKVYKYTLRFIVITVASEVCFVLYIRVYDIVNMFGHVFNLISFYLIYKAIIETSLKNPYNTLFYKLNNEIKERKAVEEELNRERERLAVTLVSIGDGVISTDVEGNITFFNKAAETITGWDSPDCIGRPLEEVFKIANKEDRLAMENIFKDTLEKGEAVGLKQDSILIKFDKTEIFLSASCAPIRDKNYKVTGSVIVFRDISERKKAEEELRTAKEYAEAANRAKSEFLANMSHEIRTPLNGIKGMIDLTLMEELTGEQRENLDIANSCGDTLLNVINDILDFSKIEAGKMLLDSRDFNIRSLIENNLKSHRIRAKENGLAMNLMIDESIPDILIGDPNRLAQVLNNIVGNAVKFTEAGGVSIYIEDCTQLEEHSIRLRFHVADTGIGIEENKKSMLFKSFSQVDGGITRKYGGTGLGLVISKRLVEMMGGEISYRSEKDKGSTFSFSILFGADKKTIEDKDSVGPKNALHTSRLRILIAEDNKMNQIVAVNILKRLGHDVDAADNGSQCLEMHKKNVYDIILMDIQMPEMNGMEATKRIRGAENEVQRHTPIIALTAYALQGDRERFISAGMDDYISKPINIQELSDVIKKWTDIINSPFEDLKPNSIDEVSVKHKIWTDKDDHNLEDEIDDNPAAIISGYIDKLDHAVGHRDEAKIEHFSKLLKVYAENNKERAVKDIAFRILLAARKKRLDYVSTHVKELRGILEKVERI